MFKDRFELTLKNSTSFEELQGTFMGFLNKFASIKCKYLRADHSKFMTKESNKAIMSQFNYCSLVWMCHSRGLNIKIKNIDKRALRIVYEDKK